eukprot:10858974-Alexandrium_andersonii.AAC.1
MRQSALSTDRRGATLSALESIRSTGRRTSERSWGAGLGISTSQSVLPPRRARQRGRRSLRRISAP